MSSPRTAALGLFLGSWLALGLSESRAQDATTVGDGPGMPSSESGVPGQTSVLIVVIAPSVQAELKLSEDQKTRIFELTRESSKKSRELMQAAFRGGNGNMNPQGFMAAGAQLRQENERAISKILEPKQKERVDQILLQVDGPLAVSRPEIGKKLGLSQAQNQRVQLTMMQMMQAQREMFMAARVASANGMPDAGQLASGRSALNKLREDATRQLAKILTAKQRETFNTLLGEPFDIAKIDPALARRSVASQTQSQAEDTSDSAAAPKPKARRKGAMPKKPAVKEKDKDATGEPKTKP